MNHFLVVVVTFKQTNKKSMIYRSLFHHVNLWEKKVFGPSSVTWSDVEVTITWLDHYVK